jgi:hypothetical protein
VQRGFQYRSTGIKEKFKRTDDLATFIREINKHLIDTGMDTVMYLPSPTDALKMCSVLTEYSKYSADTARSSGSTLSALYDTYDKFNDKAVSKFLISSLDKDLRETIQLHIEPLDTFHVLWLELIKAVRSTSIDWFNDLKAKLRIQKALDCAGQKVDDLSKAFQKDVTKLTSAGQYKHNLTLHMLKVFLDAGGCSNESYRFELRLMNRSLDTELLSVAHSMSQEGADKHMAAKSLTYKHICIKAEDEYHKQQDNNEWPPAPHATDSRAAPGNFGANANLCFEPALTKSQVNILIQRQMKDSTSHSSDPPRGNCHNCGTPGHYA